MKIYHKGSFYSALVCFSFAVIFAFDVVLSDHEWDSTHTILTVNMLILGLLSLRRSMNKKLAKELIIQESDEMLMMERLKSYKAAFWTTIYIFLVIGLVSTHFLDSDFGFALTICSLLVVLLMSLICFFFYLSQKLQHD